MGPSRNDVILWGRVSVMARIRSQIGKPDRRIVGNFRQKNRILIVGSSVSFRQKNQIMIVGSSVQNIEWSSDRRIVGSSVKMIVGSSVDPNMKLKDDRRTSDHRIVGKFQIWTFVMIVKSGKKLQLCVSQDIYIKNEFWSLGWDDFLWLLRSMKIIFNYFMSRKGKVKGKRMTLENLMSSV